MGTCNLCRSTANTLASLGDWEDFDLSAPAEQTWYESIPRVMGVLTK